MRSNQTLSAHDSLLSFGSACLTPLTCGRIWIAPPTATRQSPWPRMYESLSMSTHTNIWTEKLDANLNPRKLGGYCSLWCCGGASSKLANPLQAMAMTPHHEAFEVAGMFKHDHMRKSRPSEGSKAQREVSCSWLSNVRGEGYSGQPGL